MDCAEVMELAGAIALQALPVEDARAVRQHLASCPEAHDELQALITAATLLPLLVPEVEPPPGMSARLLARALATEAPVPPARAATADELPNVGRLRPLHRSRAARLRSGEPSLAQPWYRQPGIWAAAALFVIALGLGLWNRSLQHDLDSQNRVAPPDLAALLMNASLTPLAAENDPAQAVRLLLVQPRDGENAFVVGQLKPPPAGKVYEAWLVRNGKPASAGLFATTTDGILQLQSNTDGAQNFVLTVEPAGSSSATPLGAVIAKATLAYPPSVTIAGIEVP